MLDIKITKAAALKQKPDESKLGFGMIFTDHMFLMDYTPAQGWHEPRVVPYAPFQLDPACVVFHYAQEPESLPHRRKHHPALSAGLQRPADV